MYKLTDEEIKTIISEYGGSEEIISDIERKLNMSGEVDSIDDYRELVIECVSANESISLKMEQVKEIRGKRNRDRARREEFIPLDEIIDNCIKAYIVDKGKDEFGSDFFDEEYDKKMF